MDLGRKSASKSPNAAICGLYSILLSPLSSMNPDSPALRDCEIGHITAQNVLLNFAESLESTLQVQLGISADRDPLEALSMRYVASAIEPELQVLLRVVCHSIQDFPPREISFDLSRLGSA